MTALHPAPTTYRHRPRMRRHGPSSRLTAHRDDRISLVLIAAAFLLAALVCTAGLALQHLT
jgi:hypothetical protein